MEELFNEPGGTGVWHEIHAVRGGMEAVYVNMPGKLGFSAFAPLK